MSVTSISTRAKCSFRPTILPLGLTLGLALSGCAQTPFGPTVQVMPGPGKSFEAFQVDQAGCKSYAADQVKGQADASNQRAVGVAVLTTVLGAGLGAATGDIGGYAGGGAAIGAAAGSGLGASIGAQQSTIDQYNIQQQYDAAFSQCMYSKGDQVPGYAPIASAPVGGRVASGPDPVLVRNTQAELVRLHYLSDAPDGAMGPKTSAAIRAYQTANGVGATGTVSQSLLARLQSTPSGAGPDSSTATAKASPPSWVPPTTDGRVGQGQQPQVIPASAPAPAGPSGWVTPKTQ